LHKGLFFNQIFSVDDTAVTVVQCKHKVISMTGKMPVAGLSSAEVRAMVTVSCASASSQFVNCAIH
jgi:hypothetical protein